MIRYPFRHQIWAGISILIASAALSGCATSPAIQSEEQVVQETQEVSAVEKPDTSLPFVTLPEIENERELAEIKAKLRTERVKKRSVAERRAHARELLGRNYKKSVAAIEQVLDVNAQVLYWTRHALKGTKWAKRSDLVARTILDESDRYGYDPVFLMAVIRNESGFNPRAVGTSGEIGLMQLMPATAKWVCEQKGWKYRGKWKTLGDPIMNIRIGAAYISMLRRQFDSKGRLYLAAYNMGSGNVYKALAKKITPKDYSRKVMQFYLSYYRELRKAAS